jgi:hypothetical protein
LPLHLVDLALAVILAASLEGKQLGVAREVLELGEHLSYCLGLTKQAVLLVWVRTGVSQAPRIWTSAPVGE